MSAMQIWLFFQIWSLLFFSGSIFLCVLICVFFFKLNNNIIVSIRNIKILWWKLETDAYNYLTGRLSFFIFTMCLTDGKYQLLNLTAPTNNWIHIIMTGPQFNNKHNLLII